MKKNNLIALVLGSFILGMNLAACKNLDFSKFSHEEEETAVADFEDNEVAYLDRPDFVRNPIKKANEIETLKHVVLHYHNDDGNCGNREYWLWSYVADGTSTSDLCEKSANDLVLDIDLESDNFRYLYGEGEKQLDHITEIRIIVKLVSGWGGKSDDTIIDLTQFEEKIVDGRLDLWIINGEGQSLEIYDNEEDTKADKIKRAYFIDWKTIHCEASAIPTSYKLFGLDQNFLKQKPTFQEIFKPDYEFISGSNPENIKKYYDSDTKSDVYVFDLKLNYDARPNVRYLIESKFESKPLVSQSCYVGFENLYEYKDSKGTNKFEKYFNYNGELGNFYSETETTFRLWAPTTALAYVNIYETGTPASLDSEAHPGSDTSKAYKMHYRPGGIWELTIKGDLKNKYYTYSVNNQNGANEVCDPYAKACGINGIRGMIYDKNDTNPEHWEDLPLKWDGTERDIKTPQELSIYEVHIRDLTMGDTWQSNKENARGTFNAFAEDGTYYVGEDSNGIVKSVTTGFDHIEEMGVSAVQLLPVFDHDDTEEMMTFNWGYNPLNYNCVEGGYSSDPYDGLTRIKEYKNLIQSLANNKNKTRTIMDVVYNHVSSAANSNFTKIVPKYYFRYNKVAPKFNYSNSDVIREQNWFYHDGSGCSNEVKSEAPMMRKFIVDSLKWWASEYKVKGFRFDLMGLVDWRTLKEAKKELYTIDPDIYMYGEGWTADGSQSGNVDESYYDTWGSNTWTVYNILHNDSAGNGKEEDKEVFLGAFNDAGRNALKGENDFWEWKFENGAPVMQNGKHVFKMKDNLYGWLTKGENVSGQMGTVMDMLAGYHSGVGGNPRQSISYASCHDNFTLYDQFTYTAGGYNTGENLMIDHQVTSTWKAKEDIVGLAACATATAEAAVLSSNGVAFIQGGEELFRSKTITSDEDKEKIYTKDVETGTYYYKDTEVINGNLVSHNSYNLSDKVNAFDYSRKLKVGTTDTSGYFKSIKDAIATRKTLKKYVYNQMPDIHGMNSPFNFWSNDSGTLIGMRNDKNYMFFSGCNVDPVSFTYIVNCGDPLFVTNPYGYTADLTKLELKLGYYTAVGFLSSK